MLVVVVGGECGVEEGEVLGGGEGDEGAVVHAVEVGLGEVGGHAVVGVPESPGEGLCGEVLGVAVVGEGVEEGVGCGVVGLSGGVEGGCGGGVEDEVGEVEVLGGVVEVPGGVCFGGEGGVEVVGCLVGEGGVLEGACGVDDGFEAWGVVDEVGELGGVADVAGGEGDVGAELGEVLGEVGGVGVVGSLSAGEGEVADVVVGDEVFGEEGGESAGTAGDQNGVLGIPVLETRERRRLRSLLLRYDAPQPGDAHAVPMDPHLRLGAGKSRREVAGRGRVTVPAGQHEAARILRLGRPDQALHRRVDQAAVALRVPRDDDQPGGCQPLLRQPLLQRAEHRTEDLAQSLRHRGDVVPVPVPVPVPVSVSVPVSLPVSVLELDHRAQQ
nr:hypothetical protein [Streptomyces sioyaensis]